MKKILISILTAVICLSGVFAEVLCVGDETRYKPIGAGGSGWLVTRISRFLNYPDYEFCLGCFGRPQFSYIVKKGSELTMRLVVKEGKINWNGKDEEESRLVTLLVKNVLDNQIELEEVLK